jgi:tRNA threonylcarbamoyladenosine modification (KEOPS) complex Cgi121 subunit
MLVFFARSALQTEAILSRSGTLDALVLAPSCAQSMEELELAGHLAKGCFERKTSIANNFRYEFLLWLTGKTDIKSAMAKAVPKDAGELLIISFGEDKRHILAALDAKESKKTLPLRGGALRLEEISLSRIKN